MERRSEEKGEPTMRSLGKSTMFVLLLVFLFAMPAFGQEGEPADDQTLSPFFFVQSDDPAVDQLPLQSTRADVEIAGVHVADV